MDWDEGSALLCFAFASLTADGGVTTVAACICLQAWDLIATEAGAGS